MTLVCIYCYSALTDAILATSLKPDSAKSWFRRGIALKGLRVIKLLHLLLLIL